MSERDKNIERKRSESKIKGVWMKFVGGLAHWLLFSIHV